MRGVKLNSPGGIARAHFQLRIRQRSLHLDLGARRVSR